ncbi:bi-domain-containing oxidoreductase [Candidatus Pelagibacter sp.]|nr:bi-domain-containing oxidoreductase [Candidatus Pelagibacter sp.]
MKQIFINKGKILIKECPIPIPLMDEVLVQLSNSVISSGTEVAGIEGSKISLLKKVLSKPSKAYNHIAKSGLRKSFDFIKARKNLILPTGYSATGKIIKLGKNIKNLKINDNIACAGSSSAFHAEYIRVPEKLCVKVPAALDDRYASTVAIGSIALHGVRRSSPTLGEIFVVVGLGIIGQITLQLLKANGCRVIAVDPDLNRLKIAKENGADYFFSDLNIKNKVDFISNFEGVDAVIITASKKSDSIISQSFSLTRKKGRIVIVGDVGLNLKRHDFYEKEIDVLISSSYGPGRYDKNYENKNLDYPISYVRWTEQRNMQEYLRLLESKKVNLNFILKNEYKFENAIKAYNDIYENKKILTAVLKYKSDNNNKKINFNFFVGKQKKKKINLGVIGAGSFFYETRLPLILKNKKDINIVAVQNTDSYKTLKVREYIDPKYLTTSADQIINDKKINTVLISTQHKNHGELVIKSLKKNKNIFIEKPITILKKDLSFIKKYYSSNNKKNILFTGYNRRYSPLVLKIKNFLRERTGPAILNYKMNVETLENNHWLNDPSNGGRNIGEACHIYDLFIYLIGSKIKNVNATPIETGKKNVKQNFISTISFEDGSVANLIYTTIGSKNFPKETLEVFCDNEVIYLDNYKKIDFYENRNFSTKLSNQEKGYEKEFEMFLSSLKTGKLVKSIEDQILSMEIAFQVELLI